MALAIPNTRKLLLGSLLLLTVLAAVWPTPDHETAAPGYETGKSTYRPRAVAAVLDAAFAPLVRAAAPEPTAPAGNLFPQQTWTPPPPPTAVKPVAVAPPLPFTFAGRYTDGDKITVYLMEGGQMHRVRQGETVNGNYRLDKIEQASISFTYLPLGTTQSLPTGVLQP
jgi:hypothetical protein